MLDEEVAAEAEAEEGEEGVAVLLAPDSGSTTAALLATRVANDAW